MKTLPHSSAKGTAYSLFDIVRSVGRADLLTCASFLTMASLNIHAQQIDFAEERKAVVRHYRFVGDHREELAVYYRRCSRSLDPAAIDRSISRILDIFKNDEGRTFYFLYGIYPADADAVIKGNILRQFPHDPFRDNYCFPV